MQTNRTPSRPSRLFPRFRIARWASAGCGVALMLARLLLGTVAEALAHGGRYRGPGGLVPGARGGGSTGRSQGGISGVSVERWELWWTFNREDFLWSSGYRRNRARTTTEDQEEIPLRERVREDARDKEAARRRGRGPRRRARVAGASRPDERLR